MKTLACKDLGMPDCNFVAKGGTNEEVLQKMMDHAKLEHREMMDDMMKKMTVDEMKEMMMEKIEDDGM